MEKGTNKALGILFVIIVIVLLAAHLVTLRNVRQEFAGKAKTMTEKISKLEKQVDTLSMKNRELLLRLEMKGIAVEIVRSNFGNARGMATTFKQMLVDGGCKKMDQLSPIFDEMDTNLLKKKDAEALGNLQQIEDIIFGPAKPAEEGEEEAPQ